MVELIKRKEAIERLADYISDRILTLKEDSLKDEIANMFRYGNIGLEKKTNQELTDLLEAHCILPTICEINGQDVTYFVID